MRQNWHAAKLDIIHYQVIFVFFLTDVDHNREHQVDHLCIQLPFDDTFFVLYQMWSKIQYQPQSPPPPILEFMACVSKRVTTCDWDIPSFLVVCVLAQLVCPQSLFNYQQCLYRRLHGNPKLVPSKPSSTPLRRRPLCLQLWLWSSIEPLVVCFQMVATILRGNDIRSGPCRAIKKPLWIFSLYVLCKIPRCRWRDHSRTVEKR